jgi:hypothetical protein
MRNMALFLLMVISTFIGAKEEIGKLEFTQVQERAGNDGNKVLIFKHKTISGLDSPGYVKQGQEYHVTLSMPLGMRVEEEKKYAVVMILHGFGATWDKSTELVNTFPADSFIIVPNDPLNTWFYGYSDQLPGGDPNRGMVENYTERRLLAYLDHFASQYPFDKNRVFVRGESMGGTGAMTLALRYPKVFAGGDAKKGATNLAYTKWKNQCEAIWGRVQTKVKNNDGVNVWDWQNLNWYFSKNHKDATWLRINNGKEDASVPFSLLAGQAGQLPSFYKQLSDYKFGHQCFWDGSSHNKRPQKFFVPDDWLEPHHAKQCFLRLDISFPAFTNFSANNNPGTGKGAAVGEEHQLDNNTYDGDKEGGFNRFLRWKSLTIVDEPTEYSIELNMGSGDAGYKGKGVETVDVTPRRLQKFEVKPGAVFTWTTSANQTGEVTADAEGLLTVRKFKVTTEWTKLTIKPQ